MSWKYTKDTGVGKDFENSRNQDLRVPVGSGFVPDPNFRGRPPPHLRNYRSFNRRNYRNQSPPGFRGPPANYQGPPANYRGPPANYRNPPPNYRGPRQRGPPESYRAPQASNYPRNDYSLNYRPPNSRKYGGQVPPSRNENISHDPYRNRSPSSSPEVIIPKPNPFLQSQNHIANSDLQVLTFEKTEFFSTFSVALKKICGADRGNLQLPKLLTIVGRLRGQVVANYLSEVSKSPRRSVQVFEVSSVGKEDEANFKKFCAHFIDVERVAVVDLEKTHHYLLYVVPGKMKSLSSDIFKKVFGMKRPKKPYIFAFHHEQEKEEQKDNDSDLLSAIAALTGKV